MGGVTDCRQTRRMQTLRCILLSCVLLPLTAIADVWTWTDARGDVHFVESNRPIYTWMESDKVFYSDTPDHEDAVAVVLVWHSQGRLADLEQGGAKIEATGESPEEKAIREAQEAHYCKRVQEIYDAYVNAPRLYQSKQGEREYLDEKAARAKIAETKAELDKHCQ